MNSYYYLVSERKLIKIRNSSFGDILVIQLTDTQASPNIKNLNSHPIYSFS